MMSPALLTAQIVIGVIWALLSDPIGEGETSDEECFFLTVMLLGLLIFVGMIVFDSDDSNGWTCQSRGYNVEMCVNITTKEKREIWVAAEPPPELKIEELSFFEEVKFVLAEYHYFLSGKFFTGGDKNHYYEKVRREHKDKKREHEQELKEWKKELKAALYQERTLRLQE